MKLYRFRLVVLAAGGVLFIAMGYLNLKGGRFAEGMVLLAAGIILFTMYTAVVICNRMSLTHMKSEKQ